MFIIFKARLYINNSVKNNARIGQAKLTNGKKRVIIKR